MLSIIIVKPITYYVLNNLYLSGKEIMKIMIVLS